MKSSSWQNRSGIVYEHIRVNRLRVGAENPRCRRVAARLAELHPLIMQNQLDELPCNKDFLRWGIEKATALSQTEREEALQQLRDLPKASNSVMAIFIPEIS
jgi:hypothetical protein